MIYLETKKRSKWQIDI